MKSHAARGWDTVGRACATALLGLGAAGVAAASAPGGTTFWVDDDAAGPGTGTQLDPFPTIQDAVDAAAPAGDTIRVEPGTYAEHVRLNGKALRIESTGGAGVTTVDGQGLDCCFALTPSAGTTTLRGLRLVDGGAYQGTTFGDGGGVWAQGADVVVEDCVLEDHNVSATSGPPFQFAVRGSALFASSCDVVVRDTTVRGNVLGIDPTYGGGIFVESGSLTLEGSTLELNNAQFGGAVWVENGAATLTDCEFLSNGEEGYTQNGAAVGGAAPLTLAIDGGRCEDNLVPSGGGPLGFSSAVYVGPGVSATIDGTVFDGNRGGAGALVVEGATSCEVRNATFEQNLGSYVGGAVLVRSGAARIVASTFERNTNYFSGYGGAIGMEGGTLEVEGCVFDDNRSDAVECNPGGVFYMYGGTLDVTDSVFSRGQATDGGVGFVDQATFARCSFIANRAWYDGSTCLFGAGRGGAFVGTANTHFEQCLFWRNDVSDGSWAWAAPQRGGAVWGPATLDRCTLVDNTADPIDPVEMTGGGGAVWDATLDSCVVWNNAPDQLGGGATATWSTVQGGAPGAGNRSGDPQFWLADFGDFQLTAGSPAIDAGNPAAPLDPDGSRADQGAFPFDASYCPSPVRYCTATTTSAGCVPAIASSGQLDLSLPDDFHVTASDVPNEKPGLLVVAADWSVAPFGGGLLCLQPPLARTAIQLSGGSATGSDCTGAYDHLLDPAFLTGLGLAPGDAVYLQYWFREPALAGGFGLSDALAAGLCN